MDVLINTPRAKDIVAELCSAPIDELERLIARYDSDPRSQVKQAVKRGKNRLEQAQELFKATDKFYSYEEELAGEGVIVGVDEVGRGPVAGPLTVCAVSLPRSPKIQGINDSKQLSAARREVLALEIEEVALAIGLVHIEPQTIDALGMGMCLRKAMRDAVSMCGVEPDCVLVDGNPMHIHEKELNVVHGDALCASIACASIVAKVQRDALMIELDSLYPEYSFAKNKGYASKDHIEAIKKYGLSPIHRVSFCGNFLETPTLF